MAGGTGWSQIRSEVPANLFGGGLEERAPRGRVRAAPHRHSCSTRVCVQLRDGLPFHSKTGNQLSSPDDMGCPGFFILLLY